MVLILINYFKLVYLYFERNIIKMQSLNFTKMSLDKEQFEDFIKFYDGKIPNYEQYPRMFEFYVKMYLNSKK
jgi:hypothetical protein